MKASDPHLTALRPVAARPQPLLHPGWTARQFIVLGEATGSVYFMVSFKITAIVGIVSATAAVRRCSESYYDAL